ncbi:EF-hand [Schizophyllum commune H4-8]|uniref:EF-hand domain-containing protein n=1 Tax=Schizophyllum commune (strain H4-8 / FGSC 9210) TaxID=578458 RepID=D8Q4Q6_SCHCM|nr:EF-hand [Schizophyllum commune H4-8]KAI5892512.1 EF-hand [Schizophyllum commune H4-8]
MRQRHCNITGAHSLLSRLFSRRSAAPPAPPPPATPPPSVPTRAPSKDAHPMNGSLTKDQLLEVKDAFESFDRDGNGMITVDELRGVMHSLNRRPTDEQIMEMIDKVDVDGDGRVNFREFLMLMGADASFFRPDDMVVDGAPSAAEKEIKEIFRSFDKNGDGTVSVNELKEILESFGTRLSQGQAEAMINAADTNGDGVVGYEEFVKMITS